MSLVEALYSFKGTNNDELNFKKGDVITVTQREEGGWWEGTLNGCTGWFPSNFVREFKPSGDILISPSLPAVTGGQDLVAKQKSFQLTIMKDITDSERNFIKECRNLIDNYLKPLEKSNILPYQDYLQLIGNYEEVIRMHNNLLCALEQTMEAKNDVPRFGKVFLAQAPHLKTVHLTYCSSHPKAVTVIERYKEELTKFMELKGATASLLTLTAGLSKPFRRLERYALHLQELEKHLEESHPDRGDTQRSAVVYKEMTKICLSTRKERELALEVLSGGVRSWEGEAPTSMGDIIHLGMVTLSPDNVERYFVLFPTQLIILTTSPRLSAFVFEKRLSLNDASATRIMTKSNSFEFSAPGVDPITVTCSSKEEQTKWLELVQQQIRFASKPLPPLAIPQTQTVVQDRSVVHRVPSNPRSLPSLPPSGQSRRSSVAPRPTQKGESSAQLVTGRKHLVFAPRPIVRGPASKDGGPPRQHVRRDVEEENRLLSDVVDSYFSAPALRQNGVPGGVRSPALIPEEEKILVEETEGETIVVKEKTLVDTVYMIKDQVREMQSNLSTLTKTVQKLVSDQSEMKALLTCYLQNNNK